MNEIESKFDKFRKNVGLFLAPLIFIVILLIPFPSLTYEAHVLASIWGFVVVLWFCESIPLPVTGLIGPVLCTILGVCSAKDAFASFSNDVIFVFIGSFIIAQAMIEYGLDKRITAYILSLKFAASSPTRLLISICIASSFISLWMTNTAVTVIIYPIVLGIIINNNWKKGYATSLLLMIAYSASIGGLGTPIGTPPNLIGIGMIDKFTGVHISFFEWMKFAIPIVIIMLILLCFLFVLFFRKDFPEKISKIIIEEKKKISPGERNTIIAFLVAVFLWICPGVLSILFGHENQLVKWWEKHISEGTVAIIASSLLFILPIDWKNKKFTLTWSQAVKIDWGTLFLFGGGISLGSLIFTTGLASVLGEWLVKITGANTRVSITAIGVGFAIALSEITSNTASASAAIPIMIAMAKSANVDPVPVAIATSLGASYGFMLPISTPPNAIVYSSGRIPLMSMVKTGIAVDIIGFLLILICTSIML
jgi:sodium-dependent dicarboxylate transporter 2/3/5